MTLRDRILMGMLIAGMFLCLLIQFGLPALMAWRAWRESGLLMAILSFAGVFVLTAMVILAIVSVGKVMLGIKD